MKNFYTNRNFNFLTLFTKNKDLDYKLRFNQDIFNQREFDPKLTTNIHGDTATLMRRMELINKLETFGQQLDD